LPNATSRRLISVDCNYTFFRPEDKVLKYVFYADIFFVTNFIMDYILLKITGRLLKEKQIHTTSYLFGAFSGAGILTLNIIFPIKFRIINQIFAYFVISFIMCIVTFRKKSIKENIRICLYLYIAAFLSGGILNAVYFYTNFQMILRGMNFVTFLVSAFLSYLIINQVIHIIKIRMGRTGAKQDIIEVILCHRGTEQTVHALFDSGNSLKEPISGAPVHIVDCETADNLLAKSLDIQEKIRIIPYNSLGKKNGIMTAFECERVVINIKGTKIDTGPAYLGIYHGELCAEGKYKMILNRSIDTWL